MEKKSIRPLTLNDFTGQTEIVNNLKVFIQSAKNRKATLDHALLYGPPGLGKTTLAQIIANELGANLEIVMAPTVKGPADLVQILMNLKENTILFIDEIHRLHPTAEESLYTAMEDFKIYVMLGEGTEARSIEIPLPKFTLLGATTRMGMLSNPLRDRFGITLSMRLYNIDELKSIVERAARVLEIQITPEAAEGIAKRSRGTPRIANNLLKRVKDFANIMNTKVIDVKMVNAATSIMEIDSLGLNNQDRKYLKFLSESTHPVGVETLAGGLSEDAEAIKESIEPYLLQLGLVQKTPKGRIATQKAINHLNCA